MTSEMGVGRHRLVVIALAIASASVARLVEHFALHDVPHVMDEIAYLFEAKLIATGHLTAPVALPRAAFNMWFIDDRVDRHGIFPPGWPAVLALGVRVGLVRWMNPLLHLATVVVVGRAAERMGGGRSRVSILAAALYAMCPQAIFLAASLMSHSLVALAASIVAFVVAHLVVATDDSSRPSRHLVWGGGAACGVALATRPLCGVVIALPLVLLILLKMRRAQDIGVIALAMAPFALLLGLFNRALTGSMLRFPQSVYFDSHVAPENVPFFTYGPGCNALGFGHGCDHTVRDASHSVYSALTDASDNLTAWLLLVGPVVILGAIAAVVRKTTRSQAMWIFLPTLIAIGLYGLYWQAGVCYGARFYHAALPGLLVVAAISLGSLPRKRFVAAVAVVIAVNVVGFVIGTREITSWQWWGTDDRFANVAAKWHDERAVVMIAFGRDDVKNPALVAMGAQGADGTWLLGIRALAALSQNAPRVDDDNTIVFAKFHPALIADLASRFPGRKLWLYTAWADASKDTIELWSDAVANESATNVNENARERFHMNSHVYRMPADNFDGFRVGPPESLPDVLLRDVSDEGWPPP